MPTTHIVRTRERRDCRCPRVRHAHGTTAMYMRHGCRCLPCALARSRYGHALNTGATTGEPVRLVHIAGTRRRLQALATLGWSPREIADRCHLSEGAIRRLRSGETGQPKYGPDATVMVATRDAIARVYDQLWATPSSGSKATRIRNAAAATGWAIPLAWDDDDIDDPDATPIRIFNRPTNRRDLAPCGTKAAARRHYRRGEPLDDACRNADNHARDGRRTAA